MLKSPDLEKLNALITRISCNLTGNNSLDFLSDSDYLDLDQNLSQLFEIDPFDQLWQKWLTLCDYYDLAEYQQLQSLCLKLCDGYNQIANLAYLSDDYEICLECYQSALILCPDSYSFMMSQLFFNRGIVLIKLADLPQALQEFDQAITHDQTFKPAYYQRERVRYEIEQQSKSYHFTHDWFSRNIPLLLENLESIIGLPHLHCLEIGSWEGRSTCWFIEKLFTHESSQITCIDTFEGESYLNLAANILENVEARFDWNIAQVNGTHKVQKLVGKSQDLLRTLPMSSYDLIYIDGCHLALDVLTDAVLSWQLLKSGGIMVFDDYDKIFPEQPAQNTSIAINAFMACFAPELKLMHQSHQVYLQKI
ncbi:MAG: class I SAM-dependent methyltransferase [Pseudanabaena sp. ELA607]